MITQEFHKTKKKINQFFSKTKIIDSNKNRHQTPFYTSNYLSSDDEDYYNQNSPQFYQNQRLHSYHINQPDISEPIKQEQYMRQPRPNLASQNNNFFSQNPVSTDSNQPTQMQNEILLPY